MKPSSMPSNQPAFPNDMKIILNGKDHPLDKVINVERKDWDEAILNAK